MNFDKKKINYAELNCITNFSFLKGASHPEELVSIAANIGYSAIAITDECSLSGIVRAYKSAKKHKIKLIVGSEFKVNENLRLVLLASNKQSYKEISHLITKARFKETKGNYKVLLEDVLSLKETIVIAKCFDTVDVRSSIKKLKRAFPKNFWLGLSNHYEGNYKNIESFLIQISDKYKIPITAIGEVYMHIPQRRFLLDTMAAIKNNTKISKLQSDCFFNNSERYLRSLGRIKKLYPVSFIEESLIIANRCNFDLSEINCEYSDIVVPKTYTTKNYLRYLLEKGIKNRWPNGESKAIRELIEHEFSLVSELNYENFFITVEDIVSFAKSRGILCQGRGSAANSVICYCLGITEVDPSRIEMLFERFVSRERNEPPDIDVDFESDRREEVIQYIYDRYGRQRAAIAASVVTYKIKSAVRDVAKVLGFDSDEIDSLISQFALKNNYESVTSDFTGSFKTRKEYLFFLVSDLIGFPRHLSQHVGGFVISKNKLADIVPIEKASMDSRTVIQWDKNDLDFMHILKFDCLGLGMLTVLKKSFLLIEEIYKKPFSFCNIPDNDIATFKMIQKAETVGVFQIESRAQMAMLPRLKPSCYYDLVIEIALIRPGPIQGDMVHPYLRRRDGLEKVFYPNDAIRSVLERTLGVPLFQEQIIRLAVVAAGFTAGEADELRRALSSWDKDKIFDSFHKKLIQGMINRGYSKDFSKGLFDRIKGFAEYGFPESHAASFALIAYASAWLKRHHPEIFAASLLNSQPMGFYTSAQIINDCLARNVEIKPIDIKKSEWFCTVEKGTDNSKLSLRLGFIMIIGIKRSVIDEIIRKRNEIDFRNIEDIMANIKIDRKQSSLIAQSGAFSSFVNNRYEAVWQSMILRGEGDLLDSVKNNNFSSPMLNSLSKMDSCKMDYQSYGATLGEHPISILKSKMKNKKFLSSEDLRFSKNGDIVEVIGLVISRQKPKTAAGVIFLTLEDEFGFINLVIWPNLVSLFSEIIFKSCIIKCVGKLQIQNNVTHILVKKLSNISHLISNFNLNSRDFH
ncbi:MAG: error-prone DNA polymerase [Pseudomonadota bacterium]|nr:error-prone DNA polymerase [Pseudomonadota bacterium]